MQKTFINFKDPITSIGANRKYSGILWPNVYCGFDEMEALAGLNFRLKHNLTGELFTELNETISPRTGIWVTKQGVVVKEDAAIELAIETNAGNASNRVDVLIGKHLHDIIYPGGVAASYQIVKGPTGSTDLPAIPDPEQSVILGTFLVNANTTAMSGVTWFRNRTPVPGGEIPALLEKDNRFTSQQQQYQNPAPVTSVSTDLEITERGVITALDKGNLFIAGAGFQFLDLLPNKPNGTTISILFKTEIKLRNFINNTVGQLDGLGQKVGYSVGLRPIGFNQTAVDELVVKAGQIATFIMTDVGGAWTPTTGPWIYGDFWKLVNISDSPQRIKVLEAQVVDLNTQVQNVLTQMAALVNLINNVNNPRQLSDIDYVGDMSVDFDSTGKAKSTSPYYGKAICNGQNATPDMRGRFKVSYSDYESDYVSVGWIGGAKFVTLTNNQVPSHQHVVPYTAISSNAYGGGTNLGGRGYNNGNQQTFINALTSPSGGGQSHENRPPYRVVLTLMWIGIPT